MGRIALVAIAGVQILWSAYAIEFDHCHAYSPDLATAEFLRPFVRQGATVAVTSVGERTNNSFNSVGILPYFDRNIYINLPNSFWWWSNQDPTEARFNALLPSHPRIVIVEVSSRGSSESINLDSPEYSSLAKAGYRFSNAFCGTMPERLGPGITNCHMIFEYVAGLPGPGLWPSK
jgi:hypothetical protein